MHALKCMRYLITGGAGFIGTNLCELLVREGHEVVVIDNLSVSDVNVPYLEELGVALHTMSIVDFEAISPLFHGVDHVIHLAAMNRAQRSVEDPLGANAVNIDGTLFCLEAAKRADVKRFINVSSSSVYAYAGNSLLTEDMPLAPPHPYGIGKLAGEHYTRVYHELYELETTSLRFFSVYGPRQLGSIEKAGVVAKFIHHAANNTPLEIYGDGTKMRNFSYVTDVIACVMRAVTESKAVGETINVANPREVTVEYLATTVQSVTGTTAPIVHTNSLKGDPERNPADTSKCTRILGYEPTISFEEGIRLTYDWYRQSC